MASWLTTKRAELGANRRVLVRLQHLLAGAWLVAAATQPSTAVAAAG